jgi:hypothetical protein
MVKSTIISELAPDQILERFDGIEKQIADLKNTLLRQEPAEYLTRKETADLLKVDLSTLWKWHKDGKLIPHALGNRVYYKRSEIEKTMIRLSSKEGGNNG